MGVVDIEGQLAQLVAASVGEVVGEAQRPAPSAIPFDIPPDPAFGDLSTPILLRAAPPGPDTYPVAQRVAALMVARLGTMGLADVIERVEAKPPGFINVFLSRRALTGVLAEIEAQGAAYGQGRVGASHRVLLEFVSANPTGPLSVAHGRQAAFGDALARILAFSGFAVTREYYVNDEGRQMDLLGASIRAQCLAELGQALVLPEDGYQGEYVRTLAQELLQQRGRGILSEPDDGVFRDFGIARLLALIRGELERFGVVFDRWQSQRALRTGGELDAALEVLRARGALYEAEGALWFRSTAFGDDKDRVVRKSDGAYTYLAPDIAYHRQKCAQGHDRLIDIWGPDHHGYIARLTGAVEALGFPRDRVRVIIVQLATILRGGAPVRMSTRYGEFISLQEVMDEVGCDAARFFFLMRRASSHLQFDLALAARQTTENPVFYVQYAHARCCQILIHREQVGARASGAPALEQLASPEELAVLRRLWQFPRVIASCAQVLDPHGLTAFLQALAGAFHLFYERHRVVTGEAARTAARAALVLGVQRVLATGLGLLGVTAPARMERTP